MGYGIMTAHDQADASRIKKIILIVILLAIAGIITFLARREPPDIGAKRTVLKCTQCGHSEAISLKELKAKGSKQYQRWIEHLDKTNPDEARIVRNWLADPVGSPPPSQRPVWGEKAWPLRCTNCRQDAAIFGFACTECNAIFLRFDEQGRLRDACPECGFPTSRMIPRHQ